jgi:Na+/H+ antiporter NhaD/arsenite permease-like protein
MPQATFVTASLIFAATYAIIGIQGIPKIHIDRPSGALLGAVAMVGFGVLTLQQAYQAIDLDTILFLLGMMILIAYLELSGFFEVLERRIIGLACSTRALLALVVLSSGILSALFMNDTVCLLYAPLIIGSVANLIVLEAAKDEVRISFLEYLKIGLPVTLLSIAAGVLLLGR